MTTLTEVLQNLKQEGYTVDFNLDDNCIMCHGNPLKLYPGDFVVDRHYRFEGDTDPGDSAIVYAISSQKHGKGVLVNGYGLYSDPMSDEMIKALNDNTGGGIHSATPVSASSEHKTSQAVTLSQAVAELKSELNSDVKTKSLRKTSGMNIMLIAMAAGGELKKHSAPGPISVQVLEGSISFRTDDQAYELVAGQLYVLDSAIPHSVLANEPSVFMLTISTPVK